MNNTIKEIKNRIMEECYFDEYAKRHINYYCGSQNIRNQIDAVNKMLDMVLDIIDEEELKNK